MLHAESIREFCIEKENVTEGFPFGEGTLVFKVNDKMFCLMSLDESPLRINLKCDPEIAIELREEYEAVLPGYHMNKQYWNTIVIDGTIADKQIKEFINWSYDLIIAKPAARKKTIKK